MSNFAYKVGGLPPTPDAQSKRVQPTSDAPLDTLHDTLAATRKRVVDTMQQLGAVASANVAPFQAPVLHDALALSRRAYFEAQATALNLAMSRLWMFAWEAIDGVPVGFGSDGLLHVGVPWSWRQCRKYGLHRGQAKMLSRFVHAWVDKPFDATRWTPIYYRSEIERWAINLRDYHSFDDGADIMAHAVVPVELFRLWRDRR